MDTPVETVLTRGGIVDITTVGAKSGLDRRIEIVFHSFDGRFYITGKPGFKRDWLANLRAHPEFTLHLKRGVDADLVEGAEVLGAMEMLELSDGAQIIFI